MIPLLHHAMWIIERALFIYLVVFLMYFSADVQFSVITVIKKQLRREDFLFNC